MRKLFSSSLHICKPLGFCTYICSCNVVCIRRLRVLNYFCYGRFAFLSTWRDFYDCEDAYGRFKKRGGKELRDREKIDGKRSNFEKVPRNVEPKTQDFGVSLYGDRLEEGGGSEIMKVEEGSDSFIKDSEFFRGLGEIEDEMGHPLVKEMCSLIDMSSAWTSKREFELRRLFRCLKPKQVCAVLRSISNEHAALKFFHWADGQSQYSHDPLVYYAMLEILSMTRLCEDAKRILRIMERRGIKLYPVAFSNVMVSFSRAGNTRGAIQILNLMQKTGTGPDLSVFNAAIYVLVKGNDLGKAIRFLERMKVIGVVPNVITYNCLIKGYCDMQRLEDAMELIKEMPSKGCPPDKVTYCTVMGFLCRAGKVDEVRELMEKLWKDKKFFPGPVIYKRVICELSKHGHSNEALKFLKEADEKGIYTDKVVYSAVVDSLCKERRMNEAKELVHEMFQKGCTPDVVTYTSIIHGLCLAGELDQAKKLLKQMYKQGCKPDTFCFTALLGGLCCNGRSLEAKELMNKSLDWWTPDAVTYGTVMLGFRREGKYTEAIEVVREMIQKGFFPNPVEINSLMRSLCKEDRVEEAKQIMQECLKKGCPVNVVNCNIVVQGFCQKGDLNAALSMLDDMFLLDKHPDVVTYTRMIDALGKAGRIEGALEMANKMLNSGHIPTLVTYRVVIHRFIQHNRLDDLHRLLKKMLARKALRIVDNWVIEKLCNFGNLDAAFDLIGKILRIPSKTDAATCHNLIETCLMRGNPLLAYKVASKMLNHNLIPDLKLCDQVTKGLMLHGKSDEADKLMLLLMERERSYLKS